MAAFILAFSVVTLGMFFVSYCRAVMATSSRHLLSEEVRDVTGINSLATGQDFTRVMQLLQLCPERPEDRTRLQAVGLYYSMISASQRILSGVVPALVSWAERERGRCAYFAAVTLDRRIAFSREMLAREVDL